jgi:hypothetical protein
LAQNFEKAIFRPVDNFKQANKQKEWLDVFLKFKQSKKKLLKIDTYFAEISKNKVSLLKVKSSKFT